MTIEGLNTSEQPPIPSELDRLRAKVAELRGILREAPSALDEAGMEGSNMALGALNIARIHRANVKRWLDKVQASISTTQAGGEG